MRRTTTLAILAGNLLLAVALLVGVFYMPEHKITSTDPSFSMLSKLADFFLSSQIPPIHNLLHLTIFSKLVFFSPLFSALTVSI